LVDGKLKLILGLIWTLILHYSITMPMWDSEGSDPNKRGKYATPKQKLLDWINSRMPADLPITNFTTDWNDGRAIGALVDSCAPGRFSHIFCALFVNPSLNNELKTIRFTIYV
jgi:filamin